MYRPIVNGCDELNKEADDVNVAVCVPLLKHLNVVPLLVTAKCVHDPALALPKLTADATSHVVPFELRYKW